MAPTARAIEGKPFQVALRCDNYCGAPRQLFWNLIGGLDLADAAHSPKGKPMPPAYVYSGHDCSRNGCVSPLAILSLAGSQ